MAVDEDCALAQPVEFKLFKGSKTSQGSQMAGTWEMFISVVLEGEFQETTDKHAAPLVILGKFEEGAPQKSLKYFQYSTMLGLDFDDIIEDEYAKLLERVAEEGHACLCYSTYQHDKAYREKGLYRIRLIFPLSRKVYKHEWPHLYEAVAQLYGAIADPKCKDPTRGFFLPSCPPGAKERLLHAPEGVPITVDALIAGRRITEIREGKTFSGKGIPVGSRQLRVLAKKLQRRGLETGDMLVSVLDGVPFAQHGHRDEAIYKLSQDIAKEFPRGEPGSIAEFFSASLSQMPGDHPITSEDVQEKIGRAQADLEVEKLAKEQAKLRSFQELQEQTGVVSEYTEEYLRALAEKTGSGTPPDVFQRRLLIQYQKTIRGFFNGEYIEVDKGALYAFFVQRMIPAQGYLGVTFDNITERGQTTPKSSQQLLDEYGTVAGNAEVQLGIKRSYYDEARDTLVIAKCPLRDWKPEFSPAVDNWMRAAAPTVADLERWRDYMAMAPDLRHPLAMLVLLGITSIGKTSFARGMAQLWADDYVEMDVLFSDFQDTIYKCPALFGDEELPKDYRGHVPSAKLRSVLSRGEHQVNIKLQPRMTTKGYLRLMCGLQNYEKLADLSFKNRRADIDAILKRLLVIHCREEATALFNWQDFVPGGAIARHALWLQEQRQQAILDSGARFGIRDHQRDALASIYLMDRHTHAALEWSVRFLESRLDEQSRAAPAFVAKGKLYINWRAAHEVWDRLFGLRDQTKPDLFSFNEALKTISTGKKIRVLMPDGRPKDYLEISPEALKAYVDVQSLATNIDEELQIYSDYIMEDENKYELPAELYPHKDEVAKRARLIGDRSEPSLSKAAN